MSVMPSGFFDRRLSDLHFAWRAIRRAPGTSVLAALSLALGIGANTAIFSLINAILLRTLPVRAPQELHLVAATNRRDSSPRLSWNYPDYVAFRDRTKGLDGLAAASGVSSLGLQAGSGVAELAQAQFVSGNYFDVLGVRPVLGRLFNAADDRALGAAPWAVLGYDYWHSRFGGDPQVIGRTIRANSFPLTIVGVAQPAFKGIDPTTKADLYLPIVMHTEVQHVPVGIWNTRHYWWFRIIGRVPSGSAPGPVEAQLTSTYHAQEEEERKANPNRGLPNAGQRILLVPAATGTSFVRNVLQTPLLVLMAVVGMVLLIGCANVANMMLARGAARQREIAIRLAVGASRTDIVMQLLTESLLIAGMGGILGVALAYLATGVVLDRFLPTSGWLEVSLDVAPDARVLAFTLVVSLLTGLLAGVVPGWQASRLTLVPALKDDVPRAGGGSRVLLRRLLVVLQVALSLMLAIAAGLFARSLADLRGLDAGFRRDQTLVAFVDPGRNGYKGQRLRDFYERLRARAQTLPGVRSASLASITPLGGMRWNEDLAVEGYQFKAGDEKYVDMNSVGPRFFETLGIPLLLGREFRDEDDPASTFDPPEQMRGSPQDLPPEPPGPRVAIVTESFAKKYLANGSPIGRRFSLTTEYDSSRAFEVIGVVKDAHYFGLREAAEPMAYLSSWRSEPRTKMLCLRIAGGGAAAGVATALRAAVTEIDPSVPLLRTRTIEQEIDTNIVRERLMATLAGFFGLLALLLASVGLYGVISYLVARRTREIGIRLALGARRSSVLGLVLLDAGVLVGIGAVAGVGAAAALGRFVQTLLYGIKPYDAATTVWSVAVLLAVTAIAVVVPVRRALAVQPGEALRYE